jgi:hypothetical protein
VPRTGDQALTGLLGLCLALAYLAALLDAAGAAPTSAMGGAGVEVLPGLGSWGVEVGSGALYAWGVFAVLAAGPLLAAATAAARLGRALCCCGSRSGGGKEGLGTGGGKPEKEGPGKSEETKSQGEGDSAEEAAGLKKDLAASRELAMALAASLKQAKGSLKEGADAAAAAVAAAAGAASGAGGASSTEEVVMSAADFGRFQVSPLYPPLAPPLRGPPQKSSRKALSPKRKKKWRIRP